MSCPLTRKRSQRRRYGSRPGTFEKLAQDGPSRSKMAKVISKFRSYFRTRRLSERVRMPLLVDKTYLVEIQ
jgi:hypothetical protein